MTSATSAVTPRRQSFSSLLTALLFKCVSKHAKRIFYIASLSEQFSHYSHRTAMAVSKLNQAMRLAHREEIMRIPEGVRSRVWNGTGLETILTEDRLMEASTEQELRRIATEIVAISPEWHYASEDEMTADVQGVLRAQRSHLMEEACAA